MTIMHDPWFQRTTNSYVFLISNCHLPQPSQTVSPPGSLWFAQPGRGSLKVFQAFQATFHFRTFYPGDTADGAGDTPQICWYATPWFCILLWVYANYPLGKAPRPLAPTEAAAQQWCWPQGHGPRSGRQFKLTCCCVTRHVNTNSTWSDSISLPPDMLQETRAGADTKTYGKLNPKGCRTKQKPFHDSENPCARLRKEASLLSARKIPTKAGTRQTLGTLRLVCVPPAGQGTNSEALTDQRPPATMGPIALSFRFLSSPPKQWPAWTVSSSTNENKHEFISYIDNLPFPHTLGKRRFYPCSWRLKKTFKKNPIKSIKIQSDKNKDKNGEKKAATLNNELGNVPRNE